MLRTWMEVAVYYNEYFKYIKTVIDDKINHIANKKAKHLITVEKLIPI
jgi:hypothetical protein